MKSILATFVFCLLSISISLAAPPDCVGYDRHHNIKFEDNSCHYDFDDGLLIISHDGLAIIEIDNDFKLYVDGDLIKTDDHQRELVREFYHQMDEIDEYAEQIGLEGARIGAAGARLGVKALSNVWHFIYLDDEELEELEEEIEREAEKIEAQAEELEEEAERLEEIADELEDIKEQLKEEIEELGELRWF